ncbi:MAG: phosphoribosylformylglycinamidine synthase subunit PurS [Nitrospira sp. SB0677_bin_15]|nr:phosphoribosylformylglycinamidine synthase subunit PurS [Nitrospira sp. SB0667_bin_9]MYD30971.1 phosphoribosylformylglycinamidine synthase subunit PurS [Nitrospira sp. SB0661_bin_20]MYG40086.1 phosphoribosylformylglycinamidine synthase subunit PurS [Nitrospira sp. SB0677_bin_15]MYH02873.1 phosphoribosylformylglycinamidine synthase subunit PurS [Nitrospira sp. SB0675_bin_23]MYJ22235.1 phosphoribosylformylglycinamidine synthase subunit PurS [Nitrospira sp. SB0673_bin_12]
MRAKIHVTLKSGILDPQGRTIRQSLRTLGFAGVADVRVGKFLEIELNQDDPVEAEAQLKAMCETLLANTVIEEYQYELELHPSRHSS